MEFAPNATVAGRHTEFPPDSEARVQDDAAPADSRTLPTPTSAARARSCWRGVSTGYPVRRGDLSVLARIAYTAIGVFTIPDADQE